MAWDNSAYKARGFTLIELMIVVAIIGIIAAIAYPSYVEFVNKSRRADGMSAVQSFAGAMERHFTVHSTYCGATTSPINTAVCAATATSPTIFPSQAPLDGTPKYYDLTVSMSATSFMLSAAPIAGSAQADDSCGTLTLTHTGARAKTGTGTSCWP